MGWPLQPRIADIGLSGNLGFRMARNTDRFSLMRNEVTRGVLKLESYGLPAVWWLKYR